MSVTKLGMFERISCDIECRSTQQTKGVRVEFSHDWCIQLASIVARTQVHRNVSENVEKVTTSDIHQSATIIAPLYYFHYVNDKLVVSRARKCAHWNGRRRYEMEHDVMRMAFVGGCVHLNGRLGGMESDPYLALLTFPTMLALSRFLLPGPP